MLFRALLILSTLAIAAGAVGAQERAQPPRKLTVFLQAPTNVKVATRRPASLLALRPVAFQKGTQAKESIPKLARPALDQPLVLRDRWGIPKLIWAPIRPTVIRDGHDSPAHSKGGGAR